MYNGVLIDKYNQTEKHNERSKHEKRRYIGPDRAYLPYNQKMALFRKGYLFERNCFIADIHPPPAANNP